MEKRQYQELEKKLKENRKLKFSSFEDLSSFVAWYYCEQYQDFLKEKKEAFNKVINSGELMAPRQVQEMEDLRNFYDAKRKTSASMNESIKRYLESAKERAEKSFFFPIICLKINPNWEGGMLKEALEAVDMDQALVRECFLGERKAKINFKRNTFSV